MGNISYRGCSGVQETYIQSDFCLHFCWHKNMEIEQTETNLGSKKLFVCIFQPLWDNRILISQKCRNNKLENNIPSLEKYLLGKIRCWDNLRWMYLYVLKYILRGTQKAVCQTKYIHNFHCALVSPTQNKNFPESTQSASSRQHDISRYEYFGKN